MALIGALVWSCLVLTGSLAAAGSAELIAGDAIGAARIGVATLLAIVAFGSAAGWALRASPPQTLAYGLMGASLAPTFLYCSLVIVAVALSSGDCSASNPPANCFDDNGAGVGLDFAIAASLGMFVLMAVAAAPTWWIARLHRKNSGG